MLFGIGSVAERLRTERRSVKQGQKQSPRDPLMVARATGRKCHLRRLVQGLMVMCGAVATGRLVADPTVTITGTSPVVTVDGKIMST